ncbi:MAG: DUF2924 domain-containing protein [Planctomycetes bacterium]|nr:DUF2924 domain-containing protein [Planctomycetota bacterium]
MRLSVARVAARLRDMTVPELREKYQEVFGEECRLRHKDFIRKQILWRLQANGDGDLSERARRRAQELADDADLRLVPPSAPRDSAARTRTIIREFTAGHDQAMPLPGTILTRKYKGRTVQVMVLDKGFDYEGRVYRSLTAVAEAVTGTHWNGLAFFGLRDNGGKY